MLSALAVQAIEPVTEAVQAKMDELFEEYGLRVTSMGRTASDDPVLFEAAAAAGIVAAERVTPS